MGHATAAVAQAPQVAPADASSAAPETTASSEPPAIAASDVVLLKNGGMARGTIVEMAPDGSVSLMLPNGQSRTWPMTEVEYAGPYSRMPERATPAVQPERGNVSARENAGSGAPYAIISAKAHLQLTSRQDDVTYYVEGAPAMGAGTLVNGFARLCTAPCEVDLPAGEYTFALSSRGSAPTRVKQPVKVEGTMRLDATHQSKASVRKTGWAVFGVGVGIGSVLTTWGVISEPESHCTVYASYGSYGQNCTEDNSKRTTLILLGLGLEVVGLAIGLPTALKRDDVRINAVVGTPGRLPERSTSQTSTDPTGRPAWADALSGMTLVGSF